VRKEASMKKGIYGPIVLVLGILIILTVGYVTLPRYMTTVTGTFPLNLVKVDLMSKTDFFKGKTWLFTFQPAGGNINAKLVGTVSKRDVQNLYDGAEEIKNDFELDATYNQWCEWKIRKTSQTPIYKFTLKEYDIPLSKRLNRWWAISYCEENVKNNCPNHVAWGWQGLIALTSKCFCIDKIKKGYIGEFYELQVPTTITVTVKSAGQPYTKKISTTGTEKGFPYKTAEYVGPYTYVAFSGGSTVAPVDECVRPSPSTYIPLNIENVWKLGDYEKYLDYKNAYNEFVRKIDEYSMGETKYNYDNMIHWMNEANRKADLLISSNLLSQYCGVGKKCSISGSSLKIIPSRLMQYPVITAYIDAEAVNWVGLYIRTPEFKIVDADSECFRYTSEGKIKITIKNTGDEGGSGTIRLACPIAKMVSYPFYLDAGEEKTFTIRISGEKVDEKTIRECKVYVDSIQETKEYSLDICVEPAPPTCTPGARWCEGNKVMMCAEDGIHHIELEDCGNGTCINGKCESTDETCESDADCDDGDPLTKDICVKGVLKKGHCKHINIGILCEWYEDGEKKTEVLPADECCSRKGGIWVPPKEYSWWEKLLFGRKDIPGKCRIPHYDWYQILLVIAGIGLAYYGNSLWRKGDKERGRVFLYLGIAAIFGGSIWLSLTLGGWI